MAFPTTSLTNNQVHKEGNRAFVYDSTLGVWDQVRETDRTENKILTGKIGTGVTGFTGIKEIDHWRLTTDFSGGANPITANLERVDDAVFSKIGTGMSVSSGIWTFPSTGIWLVRATGSWKSTSSDSDYAGLDIRASQTGSGGTFVLISETYTGITTTNHYANTVAEAILDVTNTTNVQITFSAGVNTSDSVTQGNTVRTETGFMFIRIGDT